MAIFLSTGGSKTVLGVAMQLVDMGVSENRLNP